MLRNIQYNICKSNHANNCFEIDISFNNSTQASSLWNLPSWRPGRYELQNFSKNVLLFTCFGALGQELKSFKTKKDQWQVPRNATKIKLIYLAEIKNAGSCFIDHETFYINFVNCILYPASQIKSKCEVNIQLNNNQQFTCSLPAKVNIKQKRISLKAKNFYELFDSPFIAHNHFQKKQYVINNIPFTINIAGKYSVKWETLLPSFQKFTALQYHIMGSFPFEKYDFILWVLPESYYHGVEHTANTMLVLGPNTEDLTSDLLGVSSHELFHAWNICTIRPKELLPYNFQEEKYFNTGYIVEGITTYLGDLFLMHSGVISIDKYLVEVNYNIIAHCVQGENYGQSLADSSMDLWIDGYGKGAPLKKVSIYTKGMLVALILDLKIRLKTNHKHSIYDVMVTMNDNYGSLAKGYTSADFQQIAQDFYGGDLAAFFEDYIFGKKHLLPILKTMLLEFGIEVIQNTTISLQVLPNMVTYKKTNFNAFFKNILTL